MGERPKDEETEADDSMAGRSGGGDSAGGAYPNPHSGKRGSNDGYMGHGGQTGQAYHGPDQLGDDAKGAGENANAATCETKDEKDEASED